MASRIELDAQDRGSVQRAREVLAVSERLDTGTATSAELLMSIGRLQATVEILLRIVEGGAL